MRRSAGGQKTAFCVAEVRQLHLGPSGAAELGERTEAPPEKGRLAFQNPGLYALHIILTAGIEVQLCRLLAGEAGRNQPTNPQAT